MSKIAYNNASFMEPFFRAFLNEDLNSEDFGRHAMKTDIKENENSYLMEVDLPGFKKEDIKLSYKDGYLTIEANVKRNLEEDSKEKWVKRERFSGSVSRTYYLGEVDDSNIHANYENGVLSVSFPKEEVEKKDHTISID